MATRGEQESEKRQLIEENRENNGYSSTIEEVVPKSNEHGGDLRDLAAYDQEVCTYNLINLMDKTKLHNLII